MDTNSETREFIFAVTENRIGLRVEGILDLHQGKVSSKGEYMRTLSTQEIELLDHFVNTWFNDSVKAIHMLTKDAKGAGAQDDIKVKNRFSFHIQKNKGGKTSADVLLPLSVTDWLEKESTDILLHRLACPASSSNNRNTIPLSCGAMSVSPLPISKTRLTSFKFGGH